MLLPWTRMTEPTVAQYMTPSPQTIGQHLTLTAAHQLMTELKVRHLPVLDGGRLVGLLSERDMSFV